MGRMPEPGARGEDWGQEAEAKARAHRPTLSPPGDVPPALRMSLAVGGRRHWVGARGFSSALHYFLSSPPELEVSKPHWPAWALRRQPRCEQPRLSLQELSLEQGWRQRCGARPGCARWVQAAAG